MYFVYILLNDITNKFYIGNTSNLEIRVKDHNNKYKGKYYTKKQKGCWKLVNAFS